MTTVPHLRVGLLVRDLKQCGYVFDLLESLRNSRNASLVFVATGATAGVPAIRKPELTAALTRALAVTWLWSETALLKLLARVSRKFVSRVSAVRFGYGDISTLFESVVTFGPGQSAASPEVDLVISLSSPIPAREEIDFGRAEIVRLEIGAPGTENGLLAGFREAFLGLDGSPIRLHWAARQNSQGFCVINGMNRTRPVYSLNRAALWGRGISIVLSFLSSERRPAQPAPGEQCESSGEHDRQSCGLGALALYPFVILARGLTQAAALLSRGKKQFSVALGRPPGMPLMIGDAMQRIEPPAGMWQADPFLYRSRQTGRAYCFVEEFDEALGRAHISVLEESDQGWQHLGIALKEAFHLSFPFVFEHEGRILMCPETAESGEIRIYECTGFPLKWTLAATLMSGVSATDTVLFEHEGQWWMLTNIDRAPIPDHQSELHVFCAESPFSTQWRQPVINPARVHFDGARNGGLVSNQSGIYRLGQAQSFEMYGKGLSVFQITALGEENYRERQIGAIHLPARLGAIGTHSYSREGDLIAVDLVTYRPVVRR